VRETEGRKWWQSPLRPKSVKKAPVVAGSKNSFPALQKKKKPIKVVEPPKKKNNENKKPEKVGVGS